MIRKNLQELRAHLASILGQHGSQAKSQNARGSLRVESLEDRRLMTANPYLADDARRVVDTPNAAAISGVVPLYDKSVAVGTDIYYLDSNDNFGAELHRLNTITGVVSLVADINPGTAGSFASQDSGLALAGNKLYFAANDPLHGTELRWIDVTQSSPTVHTIELIAGPDSVGIGKMGGLFAVGNKLYFMAGSSAATQKLYWVDTSADSPTPNAVNFDMGDTSAYFAAKNSVGFTAIGNKLYFAASDAQSGYDLRMIDTAAAPSTVITINVVAGSGSAWTAQNFSGLTAVANKLYFTVPTDSAGTVRWLDSSAATPTVKAYSGFGQFVASGNMVYFYSSGQGDAGVLRWLDATQSSDPEAHQVSLTKDSNIYFQTLPTSPLVMAGSKIYFGSGNQLFWFDTSLAVPQLHIIANAELGGDARQGSIVAQDDDYVLLTLAGNKLFFAGSIGYGGLGLRWIDTTLDDPTLHDIDVNSAVSVTGMISSYPGRYGNTLVVGSRLYFTASEIGQEPAAIPTVFGVPGQGSINLYWVDGNDSAPTPRMIPLNSSAILPTEMDVLPTYSVAVGSIVFFTAKDARNGIMTRWVDASVPNGTIHTVDNVPFYEVAPIARFGDFAVVGTKVYFAGVDSKLRWIDTADPTMLLHEVQTNIQGAGQFGGYAVAGNKLYFFAYSDGIVKLQWIDTSAASPVPHVIDAMMDYDSQLADRTFLQVAGDRLYFSGKSDGSLGTKWIDTTADNPTIHQVSNLGGLRNPTLVGDRLFLVDQQHGGKLYWTDVTSDSSQLNLIDASAVGKYFGFQVAGNKLYFDAYDAASNTQAIYWLDINASNPTVHRIAGQYNLSTGDLNFFGSDRQFQLVGDNLFFDSTAGAASLYTRSVHWIDTSVDDPVIQSFDFQFDANKALHVFAAFGNRIYFTASDDAGQELRWVDMTDATHAMHVVDVNFQYGGSSPMASIGGPTIAGDKMYFWAKPDGRGYKLIELNLQTPNAQVPVGTADTYDIPRNGSNPITDPSGTTTSDPNDNGVLANDTPHDTAVYPELLTPPANGVLTLNYDGTFTYQPAADAIVGQVETFTYRLKTTYGTSTPITVTLRITAATMSRFHNQAVPTDVSPSTAPGVTSSLDALAIINLINSHHGRSFIPVAELDSALSNTYYDVNNDSVVSSLDVLAVINYINAQASVVVINQFNTPSSDFDRLDPPVPRALSATLDSAAVDLGELPNKKRA